MTNDTIIELSEAVAKEKDIPYHIAMKEVYGDNPKLAQLVE